MNTCRTLQFIGNVLKNIVHWINKIGHLLCHHQHGAPLNEPVGTLIEPVYKWLKRIRMSWKHIEAYLHLLKLNGNVLKHVEHILEAY